MRESSRLTDREMFSARPWRAPNRAQVIVAVVEERAPVSEPAHAWALVLATLDGRRLYARPLDQARTPASFTEAELAEFYEEANGAVNA